MYPKLFVQLLRPKVAVMLVLFVCVGAASTQHAITLSFRLVVLLLALAAWYVNATSVNDLADEKIDVINLQTATGRPLVSRSAERHNVVGIAVFSAVLALGLSSLVSVTYVVVMAAGIILSLLYSLPPVRISYRGIIAPLLLPAGYVVMPFLGGYMVSNGSLDVWLLAACYTGFMARIILKDFRDIKGDTRYGKLTVVVRYGKRVTCAISLGMWVGANGLFWIALPGFLWLLLQPLWILIIHGIHKLSVAKKFHDEQVMIGLLARLANGFLIAALGYLLADTQVRDVVAGLIVVLFSVAHLQAIRHIEQVHIAYRG